MFLNWSYETGICLIIVKQQLVAVPLREPADITAFAAEFPFGTCGFFHSFTNARFSRNVGISGLFFSKG